VDLLNIDELTCNQDGFCARICPMGLITISAGELPKAITEADAMCIRCGHCVAICPTGSLHHRDINDSCCPEIVPGLSLSWAQCEQFFRGRRSIRNFKDKPVARETLQKLIGLARYAPTGHNHQGVEWLVLGDRQELLRLAGIVCDWMRFMLEKMPELARTYSMDSVLERWAAGEDVVLRDAPVLVITHGHKDDRRAQTSCTIAMSHLELISTVLGLGGCWAGFFTAAASMYPDLKEVLSLPDGNVVYGAMMLGYPQYRFQRLVERREPAITWRM